VGWSLLHWLAPVWPIEVQFRADRDGEVFNSGSEFTLSEESTLTS